MTFKMPETLDGLTIADLDKLHGELSAESKTLLAKPDDDLTDEEVARIEELAAASTSIDTRRGEVEVAAQERADKLAEARAKLTEAPAAEDTKQDKAEGDGGDEAPAADADEIIVPDDASELIDKEEKELVTASAGRPAARSIVAGTAGKTATPDVPKVEVAGSTIVAAGNFGEFALGEKMGSDLLSTAAVFEERIKRGPAAGSSFQVPNGAEFGLSTGHSRQKLARIQKPALEFSLEGKTIAEQLELIDHVANERELEGGSIIAAGGWCAPSEIIYDFCSYETVSGILDIPTVNMVRGGLQYSKGPDYAALAASWGFLQTEAQAESGTTKVCYAVDCPDFEEVRLDAIGFCITAGVLTASRAGYPELIRRVLDIGAVAHAHKVNAQVISRISTALGSAINWTEKNSGTSDVLSAAELQAQRIRYTLAMAPGATIEAVFPIWILGALRAELSLRTGVDMINVTDQMIRSWFTSRGIAPQFVYDYQPLVATTGGAATATWTAWPTTVEFMMFPAGSFVKGTSPVIDLDTIYDSVGLSTNTYTAAFFEEGLAVFNRCGFGVKVQVTLNYNGATGFPAVGAGAGITFATPTP